MCHVHLHVTYLTQYSWSKFTISDSIFMEYIHSGKKLWLTHVWTELLETNKMPTTIYTKQISANILHGKTLSQKKVIKNTIESVAKI
mgnify:CR=1 FL=1